MQYPSFNKFVQLLPLHSMITDVAPFGMIYLISQCINKVTSFLTSTSIETCIILPIVEFSQICFCIVDFFSSIFNRIYQCRVQVQDMRIWLLSFFPFNFKIKKVKTNIFVFSSITSGNRCYIVNFKMFTMSKIHRIFKVVFLICTTATN